MMRVHFASPVGRFGRHRRWWIKRLAVVDDVLADAMARSQLTGGGTSSTGVTDDDVSGGIGKHQTGRSRQHDDHTMGK